MTISENLGFLFTEHALPDAVRAAKAADFGAVECHFRKAHAACDVLAALEDTGLALLGVSTMPGDLAADDFWLAAVPGRETDARTAIAQAVGYAAAVDARNIHVMAVKADGGAAADATYGAYLADACDLAAETEKTILIEPIKHGDVPGCHLSIVEDGARLIEAMGPDNLRLMFDCAHTRIMRGALTRRIQRHPPLIGHIEIAAVPDRRKPDIGEVHSPNLVAIIRDAGFARRMGRNTNRAARIPRRAWAGLPPMGCTDVDARTLPHFLTRRTTS
jgi:hydroxypyruvate isomerase